MTQIASVSANTAALNIETLRQPRRLSVKDHVQDLKQITEKNARRAHSVGDIDTQGVAVTAVAMELGLLAGGEQPSQHIPLHQVEAAYRDLDD